MVPPLQIRRFFLFLGWSHQHYRQAFLTHQAHSLFECFAMKTFRASRKGATVVSESNKQPIQKLRTFSFLKTRSKIRNCSETDGVMTKDLALEYARALHRRHRPLLIRSCRSRLAWLSFNFPENGVYHC